MAARNSRNRTTRTAPFTRNRRVPANTDPYAFLHAKLRKIKEIREELESVKHLYGDHDRLMEEVMPYFVQILHDRFIVLRKVTLGTETYNLSPSFFDEKKAKLMVTTWKASAQKNFSIEG